MKYLILVGLLLTLCVGCKENADGYQRYNSTSMELNTDLQRFKVNRVMVFDDGLAYSGKRGIYIITDKETGKEFIGISGIGVSELGSHTSGKSTTSDER